MSDNFTWQQNLVIAFGTLCRFTFEIGFIIAVCIAYGKIAGLVALTTFIVWNLSSVWLVNSFKK